MRAADADAGYLQTLHDQAHAVYRAESARRAEQAATARQARREEWAALRARLPVLVDVWHNWTARHVEGYEQGGNHIVALAGFDFGRLHRGTGQPLCWTPSRAQELRYVEPNAGDENRIPDCKACLRHAANLAERTDAQ